MATAAAAFALAPGLALGSFLNVVAARVPLRRSLVSPGSTCPSCDHAIAWHDNVPVLSYLFLRGRCRACSTPISWKYPLVELVTAALVSSCFLRFGVSAHAVVGAALCCVLVAVTVTDLERRIIPNRIVLPAAVAGVVVQTALEPSVEWAAAALGCSLFLLLAALARPGGMGMGDVKLALVLGAVLGRAGPVALFVGMVAALVPALVLFARHGRAARKLAIPFGPFLALGGLVALFAGDPILHAYLH